MFFMEGSCQCPPHRQSVTDLHSEGRPSDRRHWARRCLNHFWVSSSERPASAAMRHSVVGSGCLLTLLKLYSRISSWSSVGPLAVSADMVSTRLKSLPFPEVRIGPQRVIPLEFLRLRTRHPEKFPREGLRAPLCTLLPCPSALTVQLESLGPRCPGSQAGALPTVAWVLFPVHSRQPTSLCSPW